MADFMSTTVVVLLCLIGLFLLLCVVSSSFRRMIGEFFEGCLNIIVGVCIIVPLCIAYPRLIIFVIIGLVCYAIFDDDDD